MPLAHINGTTCHYRSDGDLHRPCVVLSNSLGTDHSMWDAQAKALAQHFHVLRYDTRGHGASGAPRGPYSLEMLGNDVLALLDHLDLARVHFVGLSMGGAIGQWLGIHAPQRLHKLVLANTAARIGSPDGWTSRAAAVRATGLADIAAGAAGRWFSPAFAAAQPGLIADMQETLRRQDPEGYAACCDALAAADQRAAICSIDASTLIIAGSEDPVTTVADAASMRDSIGGARLATVAASHLSNIEADAAFTQALLDFLPG
jgi:3-oxoadipate enol-lactonase